MKQLRNAFVPTLRYAVCILLLGLLVSAYAVKAHAELVQSSPAANAVLDAAPAEIRLTFTEPLEASFSQFSLRSTDGSIVNTPPSAIDPDDSYTLVMLPEALPNGVYTVSWRVVSAADGHSTAGSFPFSIGVAIGELTAVSDNLRGEIRAEAVVVRWTYLLYISLTVGGLGFVVMLWLPSSLRDQVEVDGALHKTLLGAWVLLGITHVLMLALQTAISADIPLRDTFASGLIERLLTVTRFGQLWIVQLILWAAIGVILLGVPRLGNRRGFYTAAFILGVVFLLFHSLFSHASAANNEGVAVAADWLHLSATSLWFGGLALLVQVIIAARKLPNRTEFLAQLVGLFSNYARVCVVALILTGIYAAWLQVGSIDALLATHYGRALLVKLIMILPLLLIGAVNLVVTHRSLSDGKLVWTGRLQALVSTEIALIGGLIVAVGFMTSTAPARTAFVPDTPAPEPMVETASVDDLDLRLEVLPGVVGENRFSLLVTGADGLPIEDATLIRMRFNHQRQDLGESELRPTHEGAGVYSISGANLSVAGDWRVRVSVQRPNEFDAVTTFNLTIDAPTLPETSTPTPNVVGAVILLLVGSLAVAFGGFFIARNWRGLLHIRNLPALSLLILGLVMIAGGAMSAV